MFKKEIKHYKVIWTNIYGDKKINYVKALNEKQAAHDIPCGDVLQSIDNVEEVFYDDKLKQYISKPKPFSHSKVPVIEGANINFGEYSSEIAPSNENGEANFNRAHEMAIKLLNGHPNVCLMHEENGMWYIGEMDQIKKAYFQGGGGVNEPEPHKKKYKSEPAILIQPRFKEPFYRNYDIYDTVGVGDFPAHGTGGGWNSMHNFKSITDYLTYHRKILKDKYKADDFYITDDPKNYKERQNKMNIRTAALRKIATDYLSDQQNDPITSDDASAGHATGWGGMLDPYVVQVDFEGKTPEQLNYGRDYEDDLPINYDMLDSLIEKYLTPAESALFGMPAGIESISDLDADKTVNNNPFNKSDITNTTFNG